MKMQGNCRSKEFWCPFLVSPIFHSGYTGKYGAETWWHCKHKVKNNMMTPIRYIKDCEFKGNKEAMKKELIRFKELEAMREMEND